MYLRAVLAVTSFVLALFLTFLRRNVCRRWRRVRRLRGVRQRNSDNTRLRQGLGWEPQTPLNGGLRIAYKLIQYELIRRGGLSAALSLMSSLSRGEAKGLVIVLFCAVAWIGVEHLGYVEFGTAGRCFEEDLVETNGEPCWRIEIPLKPHGCLRLERCLGAGSAPTVLAPFAEAVRRNLEGSSATKTRAAALG